jgi:hypothetical protein
MDRNKKLKNNSGKVARRLKSPFKKGHNLNSRKIESETSFVAKVAELQQPRRIVRLSANMQERVQHAPIGPDTTISPVSSPMFLRPKKSNTAQDMTSSDMKQEYRYIAPDKLLGLINRALNEHKTSICNGEFDWDQTSQVKWGLNWAMGLKCKQCHYTTGKVKLYYEVPSAKRGRKSGSANVGLQVGLAQNMISNTGMQQVLMSTNVVPPQSSGMQHQANRVGETLIKLNKEDMTQHRTDLAKIQEYRGKKDEPIPVEGDGRYNNSLWSGGGKTPFQPATQTVYTMVENVTTDKKIISVYTGNKLCQQASRLKEQGQNVICPNHKGKCTANLKKFDSIGDENRALRHILDDIKSEVIVGAFTADGDSQAHKALGPNCRVYRDTRHLGQSLKRQIERAAFSKKVFPGPTKAHKTAVQKRFAADLTKRCNAEFKQCYNNTRGNINKLKARLTYIMDAIVSCYGGKCELCKKYSFVCNGEIEKFLLKPGTVLDFSDADDESILRQCLTFRLGSKGVNLTALNSNTQKAESVNRTYSKTNPKQLTFSRNFESRIHSAVHFRNNGLASSTVNKLQAVGVQASSSVHRYLQAEDRRQKLRHQHSKSAKHRQAVNKKVKNLYRHYDEQKEHSSININDTDYKQDLSMPKITIKSKTKLTDHCYAKI